MGCTQSIQTDVKCYLSEGNDGLQAAVGCLKQCAESAEGRRLTEVHHGGHSTKHVVGENKHKTCFQADSEAPRSLSEDREEPDSQKFRDWKALLGTVTDALEALVCKLKLIQA